VILETPSGFERRDISEECWEGPPPEAMCHFKTQLAKKEKARRTFVDDDVLISFFLRLAETDEPRKLRFRFVLSLILLRKRLLKYQGTSREEGGEYWEMKLMRDKSLHKVFNPSLNEAEIEELTGELGAILESDVMEAEGEEGASDLGPGEPGETGEPS
jgi:hypothetical protein